MGNKRNADFKGKNQKVVSDKDMHWLFIPMVKNSVYQFYTVENHFYLKKAQKDLHCTWETPLAVLKIMKKNHSLRRIKSILKRNLKSPKVLRFYDSS